MRQQCSINELCTTTRGSTALTVSNSWLLPPVHSPLFHLVMSVHDTLENDKCCLLGGTSVYSWVGPASTVGWGQHLQLGGPASIVGWGQPLQLGGPASIVGWDQRLQLGGASIYSWVRSASTVVWASIYSWVGPASTVGWGQCLQLGGASLYSWVGPVSTVGIHLLESSYLLSLSIIDNFLVLFPYWSLQPPRFVIRHKVHQ